MWPFKGERTIAGLLGRLGQPLEQLGVRSVWVGHAPHHAVELCPVLVPGQLQQGATRLAPPSRALLSRALLSRVPLTHLPLKVQGRDVEELPVVLLEQAHPAPDQREPATGGSRPMPPLGAQGTLPKLAKQTPSPQKKNTSPIPIQ